MAGRGIAGTQGVTKLLLAGLCALGLASCTGTGADTHARADGREDTGPVLAVGVGRMSPSLAGTPFGQQVAAAVREHPALGAGAARISAAQAELDAERGRLLPQVTLGAETGTRLVGGAGGTRTTPVLQISQLLFDGGASRSRSEAARARVTGQYSERLALASGIALNAVETYHRLLHERRLLALAERNLMVHREFLGQMEERLEAGAGTEADLLAARGRLADATTRQIAARGRLDKAEAGFREIFGAMPARMGELRPAPALPLLDEAELLRSSPRVRSLEAELAAARAAVEAARAGRMPGLFLSLEGARDAAGQPDISAGLRLRYDLDTDGRRRAAVAQAEARVAEIESDLDALGRQITRSLAVLRSDQRSGQARIRAARDALAANEAAVTASRDQFAVGRRSILQLLDAQRDFVTASEAVLAAELDLSLSGYAALGLTGDILDVFGIILPVVADDG